MLIDDYSEELSQFSNSLIADVVSRMLSLGQRVTGKTIRAFDEETKATGTKVFAAPWIKTLDDGRGPTQAGNDGGKKLQEIILDWIKNRGIKPDGNAKGEIKDYHYTGLAFVIARRIHQQGNKIYQLNKPTGILSYVFTDTRIDAFIGTFSEEFMSLVTSEILKFKE